MVDSLPLLVYGQMFVRLELCIAPISLFFIKYLEAYFWSLNSPIKFADPQQKIPHSTKGFVSESIIP
jgi:hypothetical protein